MWVRKWERDQAMGVDSPVPTQAVSNEEFLPRPQNSQQKAWEKRIGELAEEKAKRVGLSRRDFMRTSMGLATAFLASNEVFGPYWEVDAAETENADVTAEKHPEHEYFIFDVQTHFTDGFTFAFRNAEFLKNIGISLDNDAEAYSFRNFVKEIFLDSETDMGVISGVPGKEDLRDANGKVLEGRARGGGYLPSWLMAERRNELNQISGSQRVFSQGNCAPNHYWDHKTNTQDQTALFEQIEREIKTYKIDSWKWYCHTDPGRSGDGFRMDDEKLAYPFYEKSRELDLKIFSIHKGYAAQSKTLGHYAHPGDIEKAALDFPDLTFIVYHSAIKHGPSEPAFHEPTFFDPETGDFAWHADLMKIKERNPEMNNVYVEIGSAFSTLLVTHPVMCQHLIGRNIKTYGIDRVLWGTDCLWWGSPQWLIDAFKRFQISDELCEKFGYEKLTREDKAKIFGLNGAKIYNFEPPKERLHLPKDALDQLKTVYRGEGGQRENSAYGWVREEKKS
ncbi:MAG: hypothetical protein CMJ46_03635 [Planctomyces sp.]|nr:hypothetical protein [Planctomyces sp.]